MKKRKKRKRKDNNHLLKILLFFVLAGCAFTVLLSIVIPRKAPALMSTQDNSSKSDIYARDHEVSFTVDDTTGMLGRQQKQLLEEYAKIYAETLANLEVGDISPLYAEHEEGYYTNLTALKLLVNVRQMSRLDLKLQSVQVNYTVESVEESGSGIAVYLTEDNRQKFRHLSGPSYSYNIRHIFRLKEQDGQWYIDEHGQEEDFYLLAGEGWRDADGSDPAERADRALELLIDDAKENLSDLSQFRQGSIQVPQVDDASYDRQAAVDYAQQWVSQRNDEGVYLIYDDFGGNCQNFVSQCIYAGGIDMDYTGYSEQQWKFYSGALNEKATPSGRSYSWIGVDEFYTYACENTGTGMICMPDVGFEFAEKGDVVHVGAYHKWRHALLVTDVVKDENGNVLDITVASNTADRWNYPLSAYIYTAPRLIHIVGQN